MQAVAAAATVAITVAAAAAAVYMAGGIGSRRGRRERERRHGREMGCGTTANVLALLLLEMPFCGGRRGPGVRRGAAGDDG